jgi:hypothetical protein
MGPKFKRLSSTLSSLCLKSRLTPVLSYLSNQSFKRFVRVTAFLILLYPLSSSAIDEGVSENTEVCPKA